MNRTLTSKSALLSRVRRRASSRGAAMVEGAFMALLFALFFNLTVWCAGLYLSKIQSSEASRYLEFYFASHNCEGDVPAYKNLDFNLASPWKPGVASENGEGKNPENVPSAGGDAPNIDTGKALFTEGAVRLNFTWNWQKVSWWSGAMGGTGWTESTSYVMCNEKKHGINVLTYLWDFVTTAFNSVKGALG